ncbi:MAG: hypothetical protein ACRCT1_05835 [Microcoleaceae cyanobacterium]
MLLSPVCAIKSILGQFESKPRARGTIDSRRSRVTSSLPFNGARLGLTVDAIGRL